MAVLHEKAKSDTLQQETQFTGTHRLDLSCISLPDIDLSFGLKRLSRTHMYAHTRSPSKHRNNKYE